MKDFLANLMLRSLLAHRWLSLTLRRWNKLDPVDQAEVERNNAIEKIQGNRNPFIDHPEYVDQISKF